MKQEFSSSSNKQRISYIAKAYDNLEGAERFIRRNPPASLWDWVRDRQFSITGSYLDSFSLLNTGERRALDIGCNSGRYTKLLLDKGTEAVGIDTANIPLACALKWVPQADFVRASVIDLPFEEKTFDCVICIELLHHFADEVAGEALQEIARVIKPGGLFIFDFKNKLNPVLWYRYRKTDRKLYTLKSRTASQMIRLVETNGFKVIKKRGIPAIPFFAPFVVLCAIKAREE